MSESVTFVDSLKLQFPGKVFLFGEYGVLCGHPAFLFPVKPHFEWTREVPEGFSGIRRRVRDLSPASPAGKLFSSFDHPTQRGLEEFVFLDPYQGSGGFGGSTAEFAGLAILGADAWSKPGFSVRSPSEQSEEIWGKYRQITEDSSGVPPSGVDLVLQCRKECVSVRVTEEGRLVQNLIPVASMDRLSQGIRILLFSAAHQVGRKVATHEHLAKLRPLLESGDLKKNLFPSVSEAMSSAFEGDAQRLAKAINQFADGLKEMGLELPATREDVTGFLKIPGVLCAKGTGAMQADAILCGLDPRAGKAPVEACLKWAEQRNLILISRDGLGGHE